MHPRADDDRSEHPSSGIKTLAFFAYVREDRCPVYRHLSSVKGLYLNPFGMHPDDRGSMRAT